MNKSIIFKHLEAEVERQTNNIELIASENYVSKNILSISGSELTNKYAEGYAGKRYYGGCEFIDKIELETIRLWKELFKTDYELNVQPHCWSAANMWVYLAVHNLLKEKEKAKIKKEFKETWNKIKLEVKNVKVLGMSLDAGWHLTHWAFPSFSGKKFWFFDSYKYEIDESGNIDYDKLEEQAIELKPNLIIAWASAYSRIIDFNRFSKIAKKVWAYLLVDIAHIAWLIATWNHPTPFWLADFVTSTTHKTLRGPRGWIIFSKTENLWASINSIVFPWLQGGPLEHIIGAKWICFYEALKPAFTDYINQVLINNKIFEKELKKEIIDWKKINIVSWGTDNHLMLLGFKEFWLKGKEVADMLEAVNITVNKNSIPWDEKPQNPSWIRIGTPAITSRGLVEKDMEVIANSIKAVIILLYKKREGKILNDSLLNIKETNLQLVKWKSIYPQI